MRKEKVIVSILIMMLVFALCSISVFAAETNTITITANTTGRTNTTDATNTADGSSNTGNTNATTITANTSNTNSSSTYNNAATINTSNSSSESDSDTLPYTGTSGHTVIFIIIAFVISAVYAYKKYKEYNV